MKEYQKLDAMSNEEIFKLLEEEVGDKDGSTREAAREADKFFREVLGFLKTRKNNRDCLCTISAFVMGLFKTTELLITNKKSPKEIEAILDIWRGHLSELEQLNNRNM